MSKVRVELGDWLKNVSIVGFLKVLKRKQESISDIKYAANYIEFDTSLLDNFEEEYFRTLIEENEKSLSWYKLVSSELLIDNIQSKKIEEKDIETLNETVEYFKKKLSSDSYKSAYMILDNGNEIISYEKSLTKVKLKKKQTVEEVEDIIKEQCDYLKKIIQLLRNPEVKKVIAAKNVMYEGVIQPFWTGVSILHKNSNTDNMYIRYKNDFVDSMINYTSSDTSKYKYNCFTCNNKISKLDKPEAYNLTWLVKIGVDKSKKSSHFWNFNCDAYICPVCNLIYSCLPLGFMILRGKGIFINNNHTVKSLEESNTLKIRNEEESFEEIEQLSYLNIVNSMEQYNIDNLDNEFENIQLIKIDSQNTRRPYTFNILSKKLMKLIYVNRKVLNSLIKVRVRISDKYSINLYDEVIRRLYDGKNLFDLVSKLLYMNLNNKFKGIYYIYKILQINNDVLGGKLMNYKETQEFKNYGIKLRNSYIQKNSESKISGITYRLLNALKTKDSSKFMETLINAHMYMKLGIPTGFTKALTNQDILQGLGYAFLIGLQGEEEKNINDSENNEEEK